MGKSVNKVLLLGTVGKDPEVRTVGKGTVIGTTSLATAERRKEGGEWKEETEWHQLKAFGRTAEVMRDYVSKGSKLYVEGRIQTSSWDDKETGAKRYRTEIIVNELVLLSGKKREEDDIPF